MFISLTDTIHYKQNIYLVYTWLDQFIYYLLIVSKDTGIKPMKNTTNCPVKRPKIMLISSDEAARQSLEFSLQSSILEPWVISGDWQELDQVAELEPDLLVIDSRTYHNDILKTLRRLRWQFQTPLLVLGHYGWNMVDVLEAGADFYLPAPFSPKLLRARAEVLLRRFNMSNGTYSKINYDCCASCKFRLDGVSAGLIASEEKGGYKSNAIWSNTVVLYPR